MTTARPQQRYDHRLRELVHRTGDLTIATDLGVPPSTARGWLGTAPTVVVSLEVADLTELARPKTVRGVVPFFRPYPHTRQEISGYGYKAGNSEVLFFRLLDHGSMMWA